MSYKCAKCDFKAYVRADAEMHRAWTGHKTWKCQSCFKVVEEGQGHRCAPCDCPPAGHTQACDDASQQG